MYNEIKMTMKGISMFMFLPILVRMNCFDNTIYIAIQTNKKLV